MRIRLTLLLLLANLVVFAALLFVESPGGAQRAFEEGRARIFGPEVADLDYLSIRGAQMEEEWVLQKETEGWMLTAPQRWPANPFALTRLLNQIRFLEREAGFALSEIESSGLSLAQYGLESPGAVLTLGREEERWELQIGSGTDVGSRLYVYMPGREEIYVVSASLLEAVSLGLEELRRQNVFDIPLFEMRSLRLERRESGGLALLLARENDAWAFEAPIRVDADEEKVQVMLQSLTGVQATDFTSSDPPESGLESPLARLTLEGNNRRQTLLLGEPVRDNPERRWARRADYPAAFTLPAKPFEQLRDALNDLRDRFFLGADLEKLTDIEIRISGESLTLQKLEGGSWQVVGNGTEEGLRTYAADPTVLDALLLTLDNLYAMRFISDAPSQQDLRSYGFEEPQREVILRQGGETLRLLLGDRIFDPVGIYARRGDQPFVYLVRPEVLDLLTVNPLYYREHRLEDIPPAARLASVRLSDLQSGEVLLERDLRTEETAGQDEGAPAEAIEKLLAYAREPRVRAYLQEGYPQEGYRLDGETLLPWRYRLETTLSLPGGEEASEETFAYTFTERLGGTTQIGGSPLQKVVFRLPQPLIDALYELTGAAPEIPGGDALREEYDLPPEDGPTPDPAGEERPVRDGPEAS